MAEKTCMERKRDDIIFSICREIKKEIGCDIEEIAMNEDTKIKDLRDELYIGDSEYMDILLQISSKYKIRFYDTLSIETIKDLIDLILHPKTILLDVSTFNDDKPVMIEVEI